ncbi:helix-turn-helix domain-containing protein [Fodinisporobacter ferrooxydans]|uniref:Helix-turn-helix domain-containing protein n=1 Tax=Fodinisporobacter ferrooxydans TaxID=2901836 RepID=A0ABY4CK65_9BACL|nr:helix-turn-helix domain-containing protein [Alicyclobacillaceae bacterium MYW30-H2]
MSLFGARLRELRRNTGVSQKELANHIGVTERALRFYETGDREPTIDQLIALAQYFQVSLDYLVGRSDEPERR